MIVTQVADTYEKHTPEMVDSLNRSQLHLKISQRSCKLVVVPLLTKCYLNNSSEHLNFTTLYMVNTIHNHG